MAGTAADVVAAARSQIGVKGGDKYTKWYYGKVNRVAWCAIFASWCCNQAGIPNSVVPKFALVVSGRSSFKSMGRFHTRASGYTPQAGDLIFFNWNSSATSGEKNHVGIVSGSDSSRVYTIEGNNSNSVRATSYSRSYSCIIGYGNPAYSGSSSTSAATEASENTSSNVVYSKQTVKHSSDIRGSMKSGISTSTLDSTKYKVESKSRGKTECHIYIKSANTGSLFEPVVLEDIELTTERAGTPGKLVFSVPKVGTETFHEGDAVQLVVNDTKLFFGFVFKKKRSKNGEIEVTAYDQLRYLKNKDTYTYENKTATQVIKMIAEDFELKVGELEDTGYVIESAVEDNQTLFDIIQNALDNTLIAKTKLYVLYDDFGKLMLKNIENMKVDTVIDDETAEDFDYTSSIDGETYNKIKLAYENDDTAERELYIAQDSKNISLWGILQYYEKLNSNTDAAALADSILSLYNSKTRSLKISGCFGDVRVRAGSSLPIMLDLGDLIVNSYMVCEKVKHIFKENDHTMDLTLRAGEFVA